MSALGLERTIAKRPIAERRPLVAGSTLIAAAMLPLIGPPMVRAALVWAALIAAPSIALRPIALRFERPPALRFAPSILLAIAIERRPAPLRLRRARCRFRLRVKITALSLLEPRALLVARELVSRARIFVRAARTPVRVSARRLSPALDEREARGLRRLPQLAAVEPAQRDVLLRALKLMQCRQQVLAPRRSKRRRHRAGQDHPEGVMPRHVNLNAVRGAGVFR
jgi:hypothetical protein